MVYTIQARLSATILDEETTQAQCTSYALLDPDASLTTLLTTFTAWLDAVDAVTAGQIINAQLVLYPALEGQKDSPVADSLVAETGLFFFTGTAGPRRDAVSVPAIADSLIAAGKPVLDSEAVAAFLALLQTGGTGLEFSTSGFDGPLSFKDAAYTFREYNDQLVPKSFTLA